MTENPQLGRRAQTGSLSLPNQLGVTQTVVDPFVRPRQNNSGGDLLQLGQALSSLNPGLNVILGKYQEQKDQEQDTQDEAQGSLDRGQLKDEVEAQKYLEANQASWSPARLKGFEVTDAQTHASFYPGALRGALEKSGLWNKENASPEEINNVISQVRNDFLQRANGNGPLWQKTFEQYSHGMENGILNQWTEHAGQVRQDQAERMVADDLTSQLLSHQQLPTVDEVVKGFNDYVEKSFTNTVLYPSQINRLKVQAFLSAHSSAVNSGNTGLAERIMAAFDQIPTKDDNGNLQYLSKTQYGGDALAKMHQDTYFMNRQLKAEEQDQKSEQKNDVLSRLFTLKENYRGNLPSQIPPILPDKQLRQDMESLGMDSDQEWERFRQGRLSTDNQIRTEEAQGTTDAAVRSVEKLRTDLYTAETKTQLNDVMARAHQMDSDPAFNSAVARERLNGLIVDMNGQMKRYQETGKLGSKAFQMTAQEVKTFGQDQGSAAKAIITKYKKNIDDNIFSRLHLEQTGDPDTGQLNYGFTDLNQQMQDDFLKETDAVAGDKPWDQVDRTTLRKASQAVIDKYKPLYEQRVNDITQAIKDEKEQQEQTQDTSGDVLTNSGKLVPKMGPTKLFTNSALNSIRSLTNSVDTAKGGLRDFFLMDSSDPQTAYLEAANDKLDQYKNDQASSIRHTFGETPQFRMQRALQRSDAAWFKKPSDYSGGDHMAYYANTMPAISGVLNKMESNKVLQNAINETLTTGVPSSAVSHDDLLKYEKYRRLYMDAARTYGVPTEVSTAEKPPFKPEWLDYRVVPMFSFYSDTNDAANIEKTMKNLGLDTNNKEQVTNFIVAQRSLIQDRSQAYGFPLTRTNK